MEARKFTWLGLFYIGYYNLQRYQPHSTWIPIRITVSSTNDSQDFRNPGQETGYTFKSARIIKSSSLLI